MKKLSVTIGICAYNEESNILNILSSVVNQVEDTFEIIKIYILCDNSSDKTPVLAKTFAEKYKNITVIYDNVRKGKVSRLNQLYALNTSDIVIHFDADILLGSNNVVSKMVQKFIENKKTSMVVAHQVPIKPETFVGKIIYAGYQFWDMTRLSIKNQDHIQNHYGAATAVSGKFASTFRFPSDITDDRGYLYLAAKKQGLFSYLMDAVIYYRPVSTLKEFRTLADRSFHKNQDKLVHYYSSQIYKEYHIPMVYKIRSIVITFLKSPFYTTLALFLNVYIRFFPRHDELYEKGMWEISPSTKKIIHINIY